MLFMESDKPFYQVVANGSGSESGVSVEYFVILDENGETVCTFGVDQQTFDLVSKSYWGDSPMGEGQIVELYSDFSEVNGVKFPMNTVNNLNGQKVTSKNIEELNINADIPSGTFDKPE